MTGAGQEMMESHTHVSVIFFQNSQQAVPFENSSIRLQASYIVPKGCASSGRCYLWAGSLKKSHFHNIDHRAAVHLGNPEII